MTFQFPGSGVCTGVHTTSAVPAARPGKYGIVGPRIHVQAVNAGEASCGPESAKLPTGTGPAPAPLDPQLRVGTEQQRSYGEYAAAAQHRVNSRVFDLANEIQRDRVYVGYELLVFMGLLIKHSTATAMYVGMPWPAGLS